MSVGAIGVIGPGALPVRVRERGGSIGPTVPTVPTVPGGDTQTSADRAVRAVSYLEKW